jgi:hypothetical protein
VVTKKKERKDLYPVAQMKAQAVPSSFDSKGLREDRRDDRTIERIQEKGNDAEDYDWDDDENRGGELPDGVPAIPNVQWSAGRGDCGKMRAKR